jgi:hypothetical protein
MSQMSTTAVFKCDYCGKPVYVRELRTAKPDPNGELLGDFMRNLGKIARICPSCRKKLAYYQKQGRQDEFMRGAFVNIDFDKLERLAKKHE